MNNTKPEDKEKELEELIEKSKKKYEEMLSNPNNLKILGLPENLSEQAIKILSHTLTLDKVASRHLKPSIK